MFSKEKLRILSQSYNNAVEIEQLSASKGETEELFLGLRGIYEPLQLSADEVDLNKLDEEMSPNEYLDYGEGEVIQNMLRHYEANGIFLVTDEFGRKSLTISDDTRKFSIPDKNVPNFTQEERRFVLNLLHELLVKSTLTKTDFLKKIGIN